ncbi:hypothetical protein HXX76_012456 [Chlamydomonas incerta]|uniref:Uncharacterized protein n=1 Tax=Chlamydomonas incerta TaxID=51695 RepID=A0A835SUY9_CHLIN|nr:hypothetical protein HXX76_012456 [Chlamydomonas incerta]|eukprot:KAG2427260.1 hypothetical protein HXX76_012456 [Chlamydomonas incerta]
MVEPATSPEQRLQPGASPSGRHLDDPRSQPSPRVGGTREGLSTPSASKPPVRWGSGAKRRESSDSISGALPPAALGSPAGGRGSALLAAAAAGRVGSTSVRFADHPPVSALKRDGSQRDTTTSGGGAEHSDISGLLPGAAPGPRISRVRLADNYDGDGDGASVVASDTGLSAGGGQASRANSGTSVVGANKPDAAESRAVTQLASKLIARDINYRQEFESIMETFGAVFPKSCLENFFDTHAIALPNNRQMMILTLYQAGESGDRIDGVALLKDLDRAAFKRFAIASGKGAPGAEAGGKRASVTSVQRSDKSRILTLVSTQLNRDKSFSINAGGDELTDAAHIQELIEQIDLNNILIPIGTRAKYVPATDDPESFQVPVWSLRAMHKRKQERERFLIGNDPDFKKLGQTGRDALRKRLARRSMFQQQEIIANAVVAAARAAVEPSVRRVEHSIHSAAPSRMGSFQQSRSGSLNRGSSMDIGGGGPMRPRSAAPPRAPGVMPGGGLRPVSAMPPRAPPPSTPPGAESASGALGSGVGVSPRGGLTVKPVTVAVGSGVSPSLAAKRPSDPDATPLRPAPLLHSDKGNGGAEHDNTNNLYRHGGGGGGGGRAPATPPHVAPRSPAHLGGGHDLDAAEAAIRRLAAKSFGRAPPAADGDGDDDDRRPLIKPSAAASSGAGGGQGRSPRRSTDDNGIVDIHGVYSNDNSEPGAAAVAPFAHAAAAAAAAVAAVVDAPGASAPSVTSFSDRDASGLIGPEQDQPDAPRRPPHPDPPSPRLLSTSQGRSTSGAAALSSSRPGTSSGGVAVGKSPRPSSDAPLAGVAPPRPPSQDAAARSASGLKKHLSAASHASGTGSGSGAVRGASADLSDDDGGESLPGRTLHSAGPAPALGSPSRRQSSSTSQPHSPTPLTAAGSHRLLDPGVPPAVAEEPSE